MEVILYRSCNLCSREDREIPKAQISIRTLTLRLIFVEYFLIELTTSLTQHEIQFNR